MDLNLNFKAMNYYAKPTRMTRIIRVLNFVEVLWSMCTVYLPYLLKQLSEFLIVGLNSIIL